MAGSLKIGGILKRLTLTTVFLSLILLFQNCSRTGIQVVDKLSGETKISSESDSGNGTGYGGKLTATYYNYIPGYRCEQRASAFAKIDFNPSADRSNLVTGNESQCLSYTQSILNTTVDTGSMQNKVIGLEEQIFELNSQGPMVLPEKPVEIWCVDQWSAPTIEVLSLYNQALNQAETQFYYPGSALRTELNPARSTSHQAVHLNSSYFDLVVDKSQKGAKAGTFLGELQVLGGAPQAIGDQKRTLQCRLGGYLDAHLWPAKVVGFDELQQMQWLPSENRFYTLTQQSGVLSSYSSLGDGQKFLLSGSAGNGGVRNFKFNQDSSLIYLQAMLAGDITSQLYSLSPRSQEAPLRLNERLTDTGQGVFGEIFASPAGDLVYYLDGAQERGGDVEQWLRVVTPKTGAIYQVNQDLPLGGDIGVGQFEVSLSLGKVIYSAGNIYHEVWMADLLGTNRRKIDLSGSLGSTYTLDWSAKSGKQWLFVDGQNDDQYLVILGRPHPQAPAAAQSSSVVLAIDLKSERVVFSQTLTHRVARLAGVPSLPLAAIANPDGSLNYLDLSSKTLLSVQQAIAKLSVSADPLARNFAADLVMTWEPNLCANSEQLVSRTQINQETWLVVKTGKDRASSLYLASSQDQSCKLVNKIILPADPVYNISSLYFGSPTLAKLSPDKRKLLLSIKGRLYLVPTDQHPVVEIYTPLNSSPRIEEIGFIDNDRVYFDASVIRDFARNLFIWSIPNF